MAHAERLPHPITARLTEAFANFEAGSEVRINRATREPLWLGIEGVDRQFMPPNAVPPSVVGEVKKQLDRKKFGEVENVKPHNPRAS